MKKSISKTTAKLLALVMLVALIPNMSFAADTWDAIMHSGTGITVSVSSGYESLNIDPSGSNYAITSTISGYFPQHFSLKVSDANAVVTGTNGATFSFFDGEYGTVAMGNGAAVLTVTNSNGSFTISVPAPNGGSAGNGTGIYAFLPAAGQFVNENMGSGSWADIYTSSGTIKAINGTGVTTGVSLGAFGGYLVIDAGRSSGAVGNITDNVNHPGGYDFIVEGNAFSGWTEPGCIQVAQAVADGSDYQPGDANNDGIIWYDIAGSMHHDDATYWDYAVKYYNPNPSDNAGSTSTLADVPFKYGIAGTANTHSLLPDNTYHNHSWFPLFRYYFSTRTIGGNSALPMDKEAKLSFVSYNSDDNLDGTYALGSDSQTYSNKDTQSLTLTGVHLGGVVNGSSANNAFGYADVTSGGDKIDLAWAVQPARLANGNVNSNAGHPVSLSHVSYVRIYSGSGKPTPPFGEISTEVKKFSVVTATSGSGNTVAAPTVTVDGFSESLSTSYPTTTITIPKNQDVPVVATSTGNIVYINSTYGSGSATTTFNLQTGETQIVRVVILDGNNSDNAYVGYLKLIGD